MVCVFSHNKMEYANSYHSFHSSQVFSEHFLFFFDWFYLLHQSSPSRTTDGDSTQQQNQTCTWNSKARKPRKYQQRAKLERQQGGILIECAAKGSGFHSHCHTRMWPHLEKTHFWVHQRFCFRVGLSILTSKICTSNCTSEIGNQGQ